MKITWHKSPCKITFGDGMVIADIPLSKDNTLTIYCEREMVGVVEKMFETLKEWKSND